MPRSVAVRVIKLMTRRWGLLILSVVSVVVYANTVSVGPLILRWAIDAGVSAGDYTAAATPALILLAVVAAGGVAWYVTRYATAALAQGVAHDLRVAAFEAIHSQSMEFFDKHPSGQLISRITNDTDRLARALSWQVRNLVNITMTAGMSLYYMFTMSPRLSAVIAVAMAVMAAVNARYVLLIRPLYQRIRQQLGVLASVVSSNLAGIKTIKALGIEELEIQRFSRENEAFATLSLKAAKVRAVYGNASQAILGLSLASVLYFGGQGVIAGALSIGELTAFVTYLTLLMWPMRALGFMISSTQRALAAAERVYEIIDSAPQVRDEPGAIELKNVKGDVAYEDVWFSYVEGKPVLKGINLSIAAGEKVMITGPPGSGKSTLLKLLLRFYDPDKGRITIDGIDIRKVKLESLRKHVAMVNQEPFIFSGTIRENIALGNPGASMEEIIAAAKAAKIHDFIMTLPDGYDTIIGERGITLSGGQRQRIAIARALVKNPKILLLDDPVSNLDAETEAALVRDLKEILRDKTAIIVSQRPSLATIANRVVVMEDGRIVEEGTHDKLLAARGRYWRIIREAVGDKA